MALEDRDAWRAGHVVLGTSGGNNGTTNLISSATSVISGDSFPGIGGRASFQAILTGTGALTADIRIEGSNNGIHWIELMSFAMSGNASVTDGGVTDASWAWVRARIESISGTGASATVIRGI